MKNFFSFTRLKSTAMLFVLFAAAHHNARASHAVAANVIYSWISGNTYALRLYFYRDCGGIAAPATVSLQLNSPSCGFTSNVTLTPLAGTGVEVPPVCFIAPSTCGGGVIFGVREHVYNAIVTLPFACTDWRFSYQLCCRNAGITNITAPGSSSQFFAAYLNNVAFPGNNSALFQFKPVPFQCINAPFCFSMGATDVDGDSLVYMLVTPQQTASTFVNWQGGYSTSLPIASSPAMTFSNTTGQVCVWPMSLGLYVMAVRVLEYRNGILVGSIVRDMQVNIANCPCIVLPVEFVNFTGKNYGSYNVIEWSTASESGNDYFAVERSFDGVNFEELAKVQGAGSSNEVNNYSFKDESCGNHELTYYRLRQVDYNGNDSYSKIIAVRNYLVPWSLEIYPNPFANELNLAFVSADEKDFEIRLNDLAGAAVLQSSHRNTNNMPVFILSKEGLSRGFYFLEVRSGNEKRVFKVVKN